MGLYTVLERFEECEKIYNKYSDDSTFMLFPLAVMYYKKGDYRKCKKVLKEIQESNKFIRLFNWNKEIYKSKDRRY